MSATMRSNTTGYERDARDYYRTPRWATRSIMPYLPKGDITVLDPGCGDGAILACFTEPSYNARKVFGIELEHDLVDAAKERLRGQGKPPPENVYRGDFLRLQKQQLDGMALEVGLIVGNPPYRKAGEFVMKALELTHGEGTVAMLLRLNWLEGQARRAFHALYPSDIYVLPKRPSFTGSGTDATAYAWFLWSHGRGNRWFVLDIPKEEETAS